MSQPFAGLKTTLWTGLLITLAFLISYFSYPNWPISLELVDKFIWLFFAIAILLAIQFSQSRIAYLLVLWAIFYALEQQVFVDELLMHQEPHWLFLSGVFCIAYLLFIKDLSLLSLHSLLRFMLMLFAIVAAKGWMLGVGYLVDFSQLSQKFPFVDWYKWLAFYLPTAGVSSLLLYRSIRYSSLFMASLLTSLVVWILIDKNQLAMPVTLVVGLVILHLATVVVLDSYYLAYRDELTGLPSRRALNKLALVLGRKYTVAMLDVDHFKKFNDTYGHDIGDQVLKLVATKLSKVKRGGRVFRYGGEEFTVVFPRKDLGQILDELDTLRQSVADYKMVIRNPVRRTKKARNGRADNEYKTVSVTISIGVASKARKQNFAQTLKCADEALYRAKKRGRNRVESLE